MARILLLEDDASLGLTLVERLQRETLEVEWVRTVRDALARIATGSWDLAIVDVMLPDGSGFDFAREVKKGTTTPVMFMTAMNSAENRLEGFEIGADEYLPKPFHLKELIIRVRHVLLRQAQRHVLMCGGLEIDFDAMSVTSHDGRNTPLQVRDARVLKLLVDAAPRVISRLDILDEVWGADRYPTVRSVDNAVVRLRQALKDDDGQLIRSVRGVGYRWAGAEGT
jgi:two-component system, OmpR family, phosphate regulon response regulator PhoB